MSALMASPDPLISLQHAGAVLGSGPRCTATSSPRAAKPPATRRRSPRRLSKAERQTVLDVLHKLRFADQPPAQVRRGALSVLDSHHASVADGVRRIRRAADAATPVWPLPADVPVLDLYNRFVVAWRVGRRENRSGWQIGRLSV